MDADIRVMLRKWTPALRRTAEGRDGGSEGGSGGGREGGSEAGGEEKAGEGARRVAAL